MISMVAEYSADTILAIVKQYHTTQVLRDNRAHPLRVDARWDGNDIIITTSDSLDQKASNIFDITVEEADREE